MLINILDCEELLQVSQWKKQVQTYQRDQNLNDLPHCKWKKKHFLSTECLEIMVGTYAGGAACRGWRVEGWVKGQDAAGQPHLFSKYCRLSYGCHPHNTTEKTEDRAFTKDYISNRI